MPNCTPDNCTLLVDTYSVTKSGIPNAIRVFDEVLGPAASARRACALIPATSPTSPKKARRMLDAAGYEDCGICASNSLDEYIVRDLILQGAKVDSFGIGENLITSKSAPVFGGVYKLAAVKEGGTYVPKIKISETAEKITTPHLKNLYRIYDKETGKAMADYITMWDETVDTENGLTLFDPVQTWKKRTFENICLRKLNVPIYVNGRRVYENPPLKEIRAYCRQQVDSLWDEVKRFENPHRYYVDLSQKLWDERHRLLDEYGRG